MDPRDRCAPITELARCGESPPLRDDIRRPSFGGGTCLVIESYPLTWFEEHDGASYPNTNISRTRPTRPRTRSVAMPMTTVTVPRATRPAVRFALSFTRAKKVEASAGSKPLPHSGHRRLVSIARLWPHLRQYKVQYSNRDHLNNERHANAVPPNTGQGLPAAPWNRSPPGECRSPSLSDSQNPYRQSPHPTMRGSFRATTRSLLSSLSMQQKRHDRLSLHPQPLPSSLFQKSRCVSQGDPPLNSRSCSSAMYFANARSTASVMQQL